MTENNTNHLPRTTSTSGTFASDYREPEELSAAPVPLAADRRGSNIVVDVGRLMRHSTIVDTSGRPGGLATSAAERTAADQTKSAAATLMLDDVSRADSEEARWTATIDYVTRAVVSIEFSLLLPFDTEGAHPGRASGFVVDAERGIILTNRHVVSPCPFRGEAIFFNKERVTVHAIYRDPVHDFGFLKYDPAKLHHIKPPSIRLDTSNVAVGTEVKIIGNDAGEDISILSGHISRLDRNAPKYKGYCDFNTFYLQTAANLSGGSSGSPVVDIAGTAVALQCGGRKDAATNFFLPMFRIRRALELLQKGEHIARGTIQTKWIYSSYAELVRLGLPREYEDSVRAKFPEGKGMLLAQRVLKKGPAADKIHNDDILYSVDGEILTDFRVLDEILDDSIGREVEFAVIRDNQLLKYSVAVQDLHSITPDRLLRLSGAIVHDLSYIMAMASDHPVEGVFIARPGGPFATDGHILSKLNDIPTPNLDAFITAAATLADEEKLVYSYYSLGWPDNVRTMAGFFDSHYAEAALYTRNDATGLWDKTALPPFSPPKPIKPKTVSLVPNLRPSRIADEIKASLAHVCSFVPLNISGRRKDYYVGTGIIVDAAKGLMLVQSESIISEIAEIIISFAEKIEIRGRLVFRHPHHFYAVVKYDPALLGDTPVKAITLCEAGVDIKPNVEYMIVGVGSDKKIRHQKTMLLPPKPATVGPQNSAVLRLINVDFYSPEVSYSLLQYSGVIVADADADAESANNGDSTSNNSANAPSKVVGLWFQGSYGTFGVSAQLIRNVVSQFISAETADFVPRILSLGLECESIGVVLASNIGLSDEWQERLERESPTHPSVLRVRNVEAMGPSHGTVKQNDIILELNGKLPVKFSDLDPQFTEEEIRLKLLRDRQELDIVVKTRDIFLCGRGTDAAGVRDGAVSTGWDGDAVGAERIVFWAGGIYQTPYKAYLQQLTQVQSLVYCSSYFNGSPMSEEAAFLASYPSVTHVDGVPTRDLDEFLQAVTAAERRHRELGETRYVRIKAVSNYTGGPSTVAIKPDYHYYPTRELVRDPSSSWGWRWIEHSIDN
ncbi:hypothetical protein GQ42DRAFT_162616 [Ramicandelaber brevisporus]|nr:hypothetical protein GQ42DRAFT_162616 [Ramicandelaber brevisporus]